MLREMLPFGKLIASRSGYARAAVAKRSCTSRGGTGRAVGPVAYVSSKHTRSLSVTICSVCSGASR